MIMYHFNMKNFTEELHFISNTRNTRNQTGRVSAMFFGADIHHLYIKQNFSSIKYI